ncbi:MAG: phosphatase PAP2 family protein [Candidatus Thermoplasmatota archaeon]|nr:phosphatase PAP2 family protein [Candidatus Thermoplasmatota archaeon]
MTGHMPLSYPVFLLLYVVSMIVGVVAGVLLLVGWKNISIHKTLQALKYNMAYVLMLIMLPLITLVEGAIRSADEVSKEVLYTNWIFSISGNAIRVLQDRLDYQIVVDLSILVYVWIFTFILYFTPVVLMTVREMDLLKRYSVAMMFNYIVLLPFYIFVPVTVTGFYADSGLTPLLYINTNWGRMVTSVDPLNNDFPSGHISIVMTTLLVLSSAGLKGRIIDWRKKVYVYFIGLSVLGITFTVLYLGVHWPADVFAGFILAVGATLISGNEKVHLAIDKQFRRLSARLMKGVHVDPGEEGPGNND